MTTGGSDRTEPLNDSRRVWKFEFGDNVMLTTPPLRDPHVVLVARQHTDDLPAIWIEHGGTDPQGQRLELIVIGTGHPCPPDLKHMGSAVCGEYVWHIYGTTIDAE